jgi:hypothetical protein
MLTQLKIPLSSTSTHGCELKEGFSVKTASTEGKFLFWKLHPLYFKSIGL